MPIVAIHENGDSLTDEDKIRASREIPAILAISKPH
jgi:hypothetical protein